MTQYHNPYHFVPIADEARPDDLAVADFEALNVGHVRHDLYASGTYSGRIVCRLTTASPMFVGARRTTREATEQQPAEVEPFKLHERAAIPATSLRGMISSIAEAASNSALRVLEDRVFSYRRTMKNALSAIGMVEGGPDNWQLRPLTLPTVEIQNGRAQLKDGFEKLFPAPNLKVYVGNANTIKSAQFTYKTFTYDNPQYYGLKLHTQQWEVPQQEIAYHESLYVKNNASLLAQNPKVFQEPVPWEQIAETQRAQYTRGIMRVLGCDPVRDLPNTKKHEIFIPYPASVAQWATIPILPAAVKRFYELADERLDEKASGKELLPYEPRGTKRNPDATKKNFRLKAGDLVFFKPTADGKAVAEISFSSIWRDRVEDVRDGVTDAVRAADFFGDIDRELRPFNANRHEITIAEQLFGFVQDEKDQSQVAALALAGRLYFSHAQTNAGEDCFLPPVTLRILDSPKPPSPVLYFKQRNGRNRHIAKRDLNLKKHTPQGRKFYLHHRPADIRNESWRTRNSNERSKQKVNIRPVKIGTDFYFHIDFDNLSEREIGLLLYSLKPTAAFRHKLGMGKPLGLGAVNLEPVGLFRVNRQMRYSSTGLFAERYHECWFADDARRESWPAEYELERGCTATPMASEPLRQCFRDSMNPDIRQALELLGDPAAIRHRVHTPLVTINGREADSEDKTFQWFVANDTGSGSARQGNRIGAAHQSLEPLSSQSQSLPMLPALPWNG